MLDIGKEILPLAEHLVHKINILSDQHYRRLVYAAVLDHVLHPEVLVALPRFVDYQDIVVADVLIRNTSLRVPVLHLSAHGVAAEQDHLLGIHRLHDDPGDLLQLLLLVLR